MELLIIEIILAIYFFFVWNTCLKDEDDEMDKNK